VRAAATSEVAAEELACRDAAADDRNGGVRGAFPAETADRLERIAAAYDPHGLLVAAHAVGG
jgi:hypothetical protein